MPNRHYNWRGVAQAKPTHPPTFEAGQPRQVAIVSR
jgi:hypothetical protein